MEHLEHLVNSLPVVAHQRLAHAALDLGGVLAAHLRSGRADVHTLRRSAPSEVALVAQSSALDRIGTLHSCACAIEGEVASATSDERGGYSVSGLSPGFVQLVSRDSAIIRTTAGRRARIELGPGEQRRVDLGSPYPLARCSGTVRFPDGRALAQPMTMWVFEKSRGWRIEFVCDASGAFDFELPRGAYQMFTCGGPHPIEIDTLDVNSALVEIDFTLAPSVVVGTVRWSDDHSAVSDSPLILESLDGSERISVTIQDGAFWLYDLTPRTFRVSVHTAQLLGHPPEGFELRVDPLATIELELELLR